MGKSTLFNRLTGSRRAIVDPSPGVTRDRNYGKVDWRGQEFRLIDTGGVEENPDDPLIEKMRRQVEAGIAEADVVVLLVDGRAGLLPEEEEIGRWLRAQDRRVLVGVNKLDVAEKEALAAEFHALGFEDVLAISAESGLGIGDFLDRLLDLLPAEAAGGEFEQIIRVAVVGRPNVGKSSLVNRLAGEERSVVHEVPGTTRDTVDVLVAPPDREHRYLLLDTAGMKRRKHWRDKVDAVASGRVERVVRRADVAVLVIDATEPPSHQDAHIAGMVDRAGCGLVVALNKWDLVEDKEARYPQLLELTRHRLRHVDYAPILTLSVKTGERVEKLLDQVDRVSRNRAHRVPTAELNRVIRNLMERVRPPSSATVKLRYATQAESEPPTFVLFMGGRGKPDENYKRFMINRLRQAFPLDGTPVRLRFKKTKGRLEDGARGSYRSKH